MFYFLIGCLSLYSLSKERGEYAVFQLRDDMTVALPSIIGRKGEPMVEEGETGFLVISRQYEVQFISAEARKLFATPASGAASSMPNNHLAIPPELKFLCRRLEKIRCDNVVADKASFTVWVKPDSDSSFVLRAHWLSKVDDPRYDLIAITIRRRVPLSMMLRSNAKKLGLTKRQIHVSTLLASGYTYNEAAVALQISPHTVIDHVRKLFAVLKINSRTELLSKLMCKA